MNFRKMARTKQTARKTGGALRSQAPQRATFQWSSESDKELPTSPLRGKKRSSSKSPARAASKKTAAKSSPARSSSKKSPARAKPNPEEAEGCTRSFIPRLRRSKQGKLRVYEEKGAKEGQASKEDGVARCRCGSQTTRCDVYGNSYWQ